MRKQLAVWKLISKSLDQDFPVMLLYVLESNGSSPGRQGFFMAVNSLGEMEGSIGGGIMEHKFVEMAKENLKLIEQTYSIKQQFHDKSAAKNQSGMICSGEQTILLYSVKKNEATPIKKLINSLENHQNGLFKLSPNGLDFDDATPDLDFQFNLNTESNWHYTEKTGYKNHLYIIGGGHCSLALSNLMSTMDFFIHVYDDRPELHTMNENSLAHEKTLVNDYSELAELIPSGKNNYVVIMTFGYRTDDIALKALFEKDFKYVGVLGSKKKIEKLLTSYKDADFIPDLLKKIHSPVGIQIKSQTPEEIAVSIAAEIIKVKNKHLK